MAEVRAIASNRWAMSFAGLYAEGKHEWETIGPSKRQVEKALAERLAELNKGPYRELKKIAFTDFAQKWLVDYAEGKVKPGTLDRYQHKMKVHLVPYFGGKLLQQISPEMGQGYISQKKIEGKLAPKTINNKAKAPKSLNLRGSHRLRG